MTSLEVAQEETSDHEKQHQQQSSKGLSRLDIALFGTYFCHSIAVTLPVILMPLVAAEHVDLVAASGASGSSTLSAAAFVATVASISTLGGGLGKCMNGFVCQAIGGKKSSAFYLMGVAVTAILLGICPPAYAGYILAWQEFFASIQWTACSLILANHYGHSPVKLSKGITILSLASTSGTLLAKTVGTALLKISSWRTLAQVAAGIAVLGASTALLFVKEQPPAHPKSKIGRNFMASVLGQNNKHNKQSIVQSIRAVLSRPMFWQVGIAHATAMLARTSDRILGSFFHQATSFPRSICGGLTAFVTLGFVHGLCRGRAIHKLPNVQSKTKMLSKAYAVSAFSAVGMAICANEYVQSQFFPSRQVLAAVISLLTGLLASNISFQFYQIPAMVATTFFDKNKALCLSLFDGMGFFLAAPVWMIIGKIVGNAGKHGWTLAWSMLALMFAAGGKTMMNVFPATLHEQQERQQQRL